MTSVTVPRDAASGVDLYWIPLGAGHRSVRVNGIVYEAMRATIERRTRCDLYHSVLAINLPGGCYWIEMTPVPDHNGGQRGVVAEGPVGLRGLGRARLFRYEIRRWRDGVVPDLDYAVASPLRLTDDRNLTQRAFDLLPEVPTLVWGRDEQHTGDMWSCNSVISWTLASAGIDVAAVPLPPHARAPGWDAGLAIAPPVSRGSCAHSPSRAVPPTSRCGSGPGERELVSTHLPGSPVPIDELLDTLAVAPDATPSVGPDHAALEQMLT
jgi:hypothetical protein